ncbi:hypothetical protein MesoLjLc_12570 [Mesorhizobium sp. L-8-10]|nr:hypothetical protein MesoLjLc_12570 [Mesorhizobium sp. L-8-10]
MPLHRPFTIMIAGIGAVAVVAAALAGANQSRAQTTATGSAWESIAQVLQHPRCLNCHQENVPLQGNQARLHIPLVVRGADNHGVTAMRCENCHNVAAGNNPTSRTPGAPHWQLAPRSMNWAGLSSSELCEALKDTSRNGNRGGELLIEHMGNDALVLWGWDPGEGREPVPVAHEDFMTVLEGWVESGMPCPQ